MKVGIIDDSMPDFICKENRWDSEGRKMDDSDYDGTTLLVDSEDYKKLTPMMK